MRLGRRPWLSLGQILEIFLQVFDLKYYIVCHTRDFDIEHVAVDSEECFKIGLCGLELLNVQQQHVFWNRALFSGRARNVNNDCNQEGCEESDAELGSQPLFR